MDDAWKKLRQAKRAISADDKALAAAHTMSVLAGTEVHDYQEPESKLRARSVISEWISNIKRGFGGRVIRRTVNSKRFDGAIINDSLPPAKMVIAPVELTEEEAVIIDEVMQSITGG